MTNLISIDEKVAIDDLMDLLRVEGLSGEEGPVAEVVVKKLLDAGCSPAWIKHASLKGLPAHFTVGNLIVKIPGTTRAPRVMFCAHLDTVPLCRGAVPVRTGDRIVPEGQTALGGDNRASVAALVTMARVVLSSRLPRPPITLLFTVGEENGLHGAKAFRPAQGGSPAMCYNVDGSGERGGIIGALGAVRWRAEFYGKSVHAGLNPENGVSTALMLGRAVASLEQDGWFGRIAKGPCKGTANIGHIEGGEASNQVMDRLTVTGECRSFSKPALQRITRTWQRTFEDAAKAIRNRAGECGRCEFTVASDYCSFSLKKNDPVVTRYQRAAKQVGRSPGVEHISAGLDANALNESGIPTLTLDAGNVRAHEIGEYVVIPRYLQACRLLALLSICE